MDPTLVEKYTVAYYHPKINPHTTLQQQGRIKASADFEAAKQATGIRRIIEKYRTK